MEVVKHNGYRIRNASDELRNSKEVVIEAVQNSSGSGAPHWASNTSKNIKEVVLAAIKYDVFEILPASVDEN